MTRRAAWTTAGGWTAVFLLVTLVPQPASADPPTNPVVAILAQGTPSAATQATLETVLAPRATVVTRSGIVAALHRVGIDLRLGLSLPPDTARTLVQVAADHHVDGLVLVRTVATKTSRQVSFEVCDAHNVICQPERTVALPLKAARTDKTRFADLLDDIGKITPPPERPAPSPAPAPPTPPTIDPSLPPAGPVAAVVTPPPPPAPVIPPPISGDDVAYARVSAEVDFDGGGRSFAYSDGFTKNLRSYSVRFAPGAALWAEAYPWAGIYPILGDIGVVGDIRGAFDVQSQSTGTQGVTTNWVHFDAGLRYRFRLGPPVHPFSFGASIAYGREAFTFSPEGPNYPADVYSWMRVQLDGRIPVGPLGITWSAAYLDVLSADDINIAFRGQTTGGVEFGAGLAYSLTRHWEIDARGIYTRFFMTYNPNPGDTYIAGGALDQFFHGELGVKYFF